MPPMHPAMEREMAEGSYNQFCPVAMAAEILCTRWTIVLLRELVAGSTRFNELRRGVPRIANFGVSDRRFRFKPAGGFGGNRQAVSVQSGTPLRMGFWSRLWRTAAV